MCSGNRSLATTPSSSCSILAFRSEWSTVSECSSRLHAGGTSKMFRVITPSSLLLNPPCQVPYAKLPLCTSDSGQRLRSTFEFQLQAAACRKLAKFWGAWWDSLRFQCLQTMQALRASCRDLTEEKKWVDEFISTNNYQNQWVCAWHPARHGFRDCCRASRDRGVQASNGDPEEARRGWHAAGDLQTTVSSSCEVLERIAGRADYSPDHVRRGD